MKKGMTPKQYREWIRRSLVLQKERMDEADRFKRAYKGDYAIKPRSSGLDHDKDEVAVNFVYAYVETVRPTLVPGTPRAFAEAENEESKPAVPHYQSVINKLIRKLNVKKQTKKIVEDHFYSYAGILTDWEFEEEPVFEDGEPVYEMNEETGEPMVDEETGEPIQKMLVLKDFPIWRRLAPRNILLDPDSEAREEDRRRGYRMILTWSEWKSMAGINPAVKKKIRPRQLPKELSPQGDDASRNSDRNWVILYKIYDIEFDKVVILSENENVEEFVFEIDWPYEFEASGDRFPITIHDAKWDDENPYSFGAFKAYWSQIMERNKLRSMLQANVRRHQPGWLSKKGIMDDAQKAKFVEASTGELCETNGDPSQIIVRPLPQVPGDFFAHDKSVGEDVEETSGLYEYGTQAAADTATEASILNSKSNIRKGEGKADLNETLAISFSKLGQLCMQFMKTPIAIQIRNPKNPQELSWMKVAGEQIKGEFALTVKPGIQEVENEDLKKQQTLKAVEILGNNPHTDQRKLAEKVATDVLDWEPEEILLPTDQAMANIAAQQQAEAGKNKKDEQEIKFSPIKVELLAPQVQAMIIMAAMKQNGVQEAMQGILPQGEGADIPPSVGINPESPSMAGSAPLENSVMPDSSINQAPSLRDGQNIPPATPVGPMSEAQGGIT